MDASPATVSPVSELRGGSSHNPAFARMGFDLRSRKSLRRSSARRGRAKSGRHPRSAALFGPHQTSRLIYTTWMGLDGNPSSLNRLNVDELNCATRREPSRCPWCRGGFQPQSGEHLAPGRVDARRRVHGRDNLPKLPAAPILFLGVIAQHSSNMSKSGSR